MPKSKHRKKKSSKRNRPTSKGHKDDIVFMKHPFSNIPRDILLKGLAEVGEKNINEFPSDLLEVENILCSIDPILAIAILTTYGLMASVDEKGNVKSYKGDKFNQSHVELIQALALKIAPEKISVEFPLPDKIQELFDLTETLAESYHLRRLSELGRDRSDEEKAVKLIQEGLRLHTQVVRNWGYLSKVISITKRLCEPINTIFEQKIGLNATELIDFFYLLLHRQEQIANERINKIKPAVTAKTKEEMLNEYHNAFPNLEDSREVMLNFASEHEIPLNALKSMILSHSDLSLAASYSFDLTTIAKESNLKEKDIQSALNHLSISLGELSENNSEHFFLENPVWLKPIIKIDEKNYFCAIPQAFFSFIFPILSNLLSGDSASLKTYESRRAEFLESEIANLFNKAFPHCEQYAGYKWFENRVAQGENDLMIRVDSHLILIEAKSHSISWPALRGAPARAKKHVQDILLAPSEQSLKLKERISLALIEPEKQDTLLPDFPIDLTQVKTILRLSVTLEDFATLQTMIHHTKKAGWIPEEHEIAPCLLLADLEIVFDILKTTPEKIHYLKRRAELEKNADYKGDELDLLGFYLKTGFNIGESEFDGTHLLLTGMSKPIDTYYEALEEKIYLEKPRLKLTRWWVDICQKIQDRELAQWSDIANILLNVSYNEQEQLFKKFKTITKNVHKNWRVKNHLCSIIMVPHRHRSDAIVLFAFKEQHKEKRYTSMENIASQVFEEHHIQRCLIIGVNIDEMHYPYSVIAVYFRPKESDILK